MPPKARPGSNRPTINSKNLQPPKIGSSSTSTKETSSGLSQEAEDQFELELCWCIRQLEMCLATDKIPEKQANDLNKNINILKSNNAPLIKKRQVMRNTLGNYREKMAMDEQKLGKNASSIKFMTVPSHNKRCMFLRKAACTSTQHKQNADIAVATTNCNTNVAIHDVQLFKFNFQIKE